jgi:hypothetical protein
MPANGKAPWGQIREVRAHEVPPERHGNSPGKYWQLYLDVSLRLEQTNGSAALAIPFGTRRAAGSACSALARYFKRRGEDVARLTTGVDHEGTPTLYVQRGENWSK